MPHPCQHPPYDWGQPTNELGLTEPGHDEPRTTYQFDLLNDMPLALEGIWHRLYPSTRAQEQ
jgi:hypothetical protein